MMDRMTSSAVSSPVIRVFGRILGALLLAVVVAACGGGSKGGKTTPGGGKGSGGGDSQSMKDGVDPTDPTTGGGATGGGNDGGGGTAGGGAAGMPDPGGGGGATAEPEDPTGPPVIAPNLDPDPAQARVQVEKHLTVARQALSGTTPDAETALREARLALSIDAANVDAAAMVAFAYYHKRLYDTAELVLDDLYKRENAKSNANVNYVYGLIYDKTNRPERAVLAYQKAVGINPNHASALVNLGVHQLKNSQYGQATQTFERLTREFNRNDAITLTSLGSAYRGRSADYSSGSGDRNQLVGKAEAQYKRALQTNANYGPAYYNLGLLYLDNDPFPGITDSIVRLNAAKAWFDQYKNMPGVDIKLYDDRMKDVTKAIKKAEKLKKAKARKR
jgi:tetratricopeptide (TPR) repeat protein